MKKTAEQIIAELQEWTANLPAIRVKLINDYLAI